MEWINILSEWKYDEYGNRLYIDSMGKIILKLKEKWEKRVIGKYDKKKWYIEVRRWIQHYMACIDWRWFNYYLVDSLPRDMIVVVKSEWFSLKFKITVEEILKKWQFLHFLSQWFEKQIFVKKSDFWLL